MATAFIVGIDSPKAFSASFTGRAIYQTSDGRIIDADAVRGIFTLIYFGSTDSDVCSGTLPKMVTTIFQARGALPEHQLRGVFITDTPGIDTPPNMRNCMGSLSGQIVGLTPTREQAALLANDFKGGGSVFYLLDKNGNIVTTLDADNDADTLTAELSRRIR